MVQILSVEEAKRGTSLVKVEMTSGDVYNIGFLSLMPARDQQRYRAAISKFLNEFETGESDDMFNYLARRMVQNLMVMPLYIMPDRNDERARIGRRIKELRDRRNMEAKTLSQKTDIDAANLCRIEQGKYSAGLDMLCKIATALDAKVDIIPNKPQDDNLLFERKAWIVPSNMDVFDIRNCISEFNFCYWQQYYPFQIGDILYMYMTKPYQKVCYKFVVSDVDLHYCDEISSQNKFWREQESIQKGIDNNRFARIKYVSELEGSVALSLDTLLKKGYLKGAPQRAYPIGSDFVHYIEENGDIDK